MAIYNDKKHSISTELESLNYSDIYPEAVTEENDLKTTEKTQKAALLIATTWKGYKQKKHTFKVILNPQIKLSLKYRGEASSLELGLKDEKGNQLAIYSDGYTKLTEEEKTRLKDPNVSHKEKVASLREKGLSLVCYFSDKDLQTRQFTSLKSKRLQKYGDGNCVVIKDGKIYIYPKVRSDSYRGQKESSRNHSSASRGEPVDFSGTLKKEEDRWVLSNLSGHYLTRASKLAFCLKEFEKAGFPLEEIDVEHRILVSTAYAKKFFNRSFKKERGATKDKKFLVKRTNAVEWINQTSRLSCQKKTGLENPLSKIEPVSETNELSIPKKTGPEEALAKKTYNNSCCTIS